MTRPACGNNIPSTTRWQRRAALATLSVVAATLCFYRLGDNGVHELDEAWHAQVVVEMHRTGTWWRPTAFGQPFFSKPTMPLWLATASYDFLEPRILPTRFWAATFAVAAVLATYFLAEGLSGAAVGLLAGLALTTSHTFVHTHCARTGEFDSWLVFFFVAATALFVRAQRTGRGWVLCAAVTALASQAKALAGLVPAFVFVLSLWMVPPQQRPSRRQVAAAALMFVLITLAWLVPMTLVHGRLFLEQHIGTELLQRPFRSGSLSVINVSGRYLAMLLAGFSPWAVLGLAGLVEEARKAVAGRDAGSIVLLTWSITLAALLCFGLRKGFCWYLIPLFPFLAAIAARFILLTDPRPRWAEAWRVIACMLAVGATLTRQLRNIAVPFALWSITPPVLVPSSTVRTLSLILVLVSTSAVAAAWPAHEPNGARRARRLMSWPTLSVLTIAAFLGVGQPLALADHRNAYTQAVAALEAVRAGRNGTLVVNTTAGHFDILTRHYFANLEGIQTIFVRRGAAAAWARASQLSGTRWCVLVAPAGQLPRLEGIGDRLVFRGSERTPLGTPRIDVAVFELPRTDGQAVVEGGAP